MYAPNYGVNLESNISTEYGNDVYVTWSIDYLMLIITIGVYSLLGTAGNLPVLVVYFRKRDKKAANTFIRVLAIIDLLVCVVIMPYTLIYELHLVQSDIICRGVEFVRHFTVIASNMTLVAIAVERYCAVCHLSQRFSVQNVNQGMVVVLTVSFILAFPAIGMFAVVPASAVQDIECAFPHVSNNTMFCHFTTSVVGETVTYIYQGVLMLSFFISLIMILIFYTIVYSVLWKRAKIRNARLKQMESEMAEKSVVSNGLYQTNIFITAHHNAKFTDYKIPDFSEITKTRIPDHNHALDLFRPVNEKRNTSSYRSSYTGSGSESSVITGSDVLATSSNTGQSSSTEETRVSATSISTLMRNRHHNLHHRTAKMLFLCTIIYVVSWLPFWFDIFGLTSNIVMRYTFFVGNATNPLVYGIVNEHVRKAFVRLIYDCKPNSSAMCGNNKNNACNNNNEKRCQNTEHTIYSRH